MSQDAWASSSRSERPADKLYNVGIYIRLSRENTEYTGRDSMSIENQEAMLSKFIAIMPGWVKTRTYIDNGASGGNFNRQGFKDMMGDVRDGTINLVLVQDLSRFGRNYLETGKYLEEELPALGCRFVALVDGVDTEDGENDIIPFLNALNDFYLKNISDRIKVVFSAKAKAGHKLTGTPPYGYIRSTDDHRKLMVDKYAAKVVRKIFAMRADGLGYARIVSALNAEHIPPPRLHFYLRQNREPVDGCSKLWRICSISEIIRDECYLGHTNSFKFSRNYRSSKLRRCPKEGWLKTENTHEAIITQELWDKAQTVNARLSKCSENARAPQPSLYLKKIFCADCKHPMIAAIKYKASGERRTTYICSTYNVTGRHACSRHGIMEKMLNQILLSDIKKQAEQLHLDEQHVIDSLLKRLVSGYATDMVDSQKQFQALRLELHQLDMKLEQLYEDKVVGTISSEMFLKLSVKTESQREEIAERIEQLDRNREMVKTKRNDIQNWIRLIGENIMVQDVNRDLLEALIDRVEIGEKKPENGVMTQDVKVFYKFVGMV